MPNYGEVPGEAVYMLTRRGRSGSRAADDAQPRQLIVSLSSSDAGWPSRPRRPALRSCRRPRRALLVADGRVVGVRTGDKGRGRDGEELPELRAGLGHRREGHRSRRGHPGAPDQVAIDHFGLRGAEPQVWALGVKEVWKVAKAARPHHPHDGLAAAPGAKYREFGGSFIYPMGDDMLTIGMVVGLDYRDVARRSTTCCRSSRRIRRSCRMLEGGERIELGREDDPGGRLPRAAERLTRRGC